MDELETPATQITDPARRIIDRALAESHRRNQPLTNGHFFLGFVQAEWDLFAGVMQDLGLNPHMIQKELEEQLRLLPAVAARERLVGPLTAKLAVKLALHHANRAGRPAIEAVDIVAAVCETEGAAATILRRHGIAPERVAAQLDSRRREDEGREERLKRRYELPPILKHFGTNLNWIARQDTLPPVYGRDLETQRVIEILSHRERANSVMLVGEPGVGKTALVEGLARRIECQPDSIPVRLRDIQIVSLPMHGMVAGTMLRGMFEDRIQNVIREVKEHPNLILFVDEVHTMIGAGSALGAPSDAADMFKSVLARGEVRMIGATTLGEYKQHIQEDEALARRFRTVHIAEPTLDETRRIIDYLRPRFERNYAVRLSDEAIDTALELAPRYLRHLHLPDKPIGWLDTAAVRAEIDGRWEATANDVMSVIADAAQIPSDMVRRDVTARFHSIEEQLAARVVGQSEAIRAVARRLMLNKGPLKDGFDRPDGVLLFLGPTGVGKTELAKSVAAVLFGDDRKMIRVDMSEYQDGAVAVDKLIGMPRGIAGSDRGGVLTNQLRDTPYTVILLDEVEKASASVLNLFLQAFDEGWLTDGRGRRVYLSDAIVIMTSNLGSEHFRQLTSPLGFRAQGVGLDQIRGEVFRELERRFSPEFRNRIDDVVLFAPLTKTDVLTIARRYLERVATTLCGSHKLLDVEPDALQRLVELGSHPSYGARFLKRAIDRHVKMPISARWHDGNTFRVVVRGDEVVVDVASTPRLVACGEPEELAYGT